MKRIIFLFTLAALPLCAAMNDSLFLGAPPQRQLVVNNRILVNINGKPISVVDVMKKLDVIFYQQYAEYADNVEARYQFYTMQWKRAFQELVDKELVMADAAENPIPISSGDVRQEMEMLFGPNIIANLDKINLTYSDAFEMLQGDLILRRMMMYRVNMKAMRKVTPQRIQEAYAGFAAENIQPPRWTYQVITFRHDDPKLCRRVAETGYSLLSADIALGQLSSRLESVGASSDVSVNVSKTFDQEESEVAPANLEVLKNLGLNEFSKPVEQKSRKENTLVYRVYYLIDKKEGGPIPFAEAEKRINDKLLEQAVAEEGAAYMKKLRDHYGVSEKLIKDLTEKDFHPFELN